MPYQQLSAADRLRQRQEAAKASVEQSTQKFNASQEAFNQYQQDYITGKRNPVADLLKKPERDAQREARLKQVAVIGAIGDAVGLIGKGYAAARGVRPQKTEGVSTYKALGELQRLDDIYRQESYNYDHQVMLDGLRRKQTGDRAQELAVANAREDRNYERGKLDQANQNMLGYNLAEEREAKAVAEKAAERKYTEKREDKRFGQQLYLSRLSGRGENEFKISSANIAMVVKNPKTGKFEPMADGDFSMVLNSAIKTDPTIQEELSNARTQSEYEQIAKMYVTNHLQAQGVQAKEQEYKITQNQTMVASAKDLKSNGYSSISIASLRNMTGGALKNISDKDIIEQYAKGGVSVIK